MAFETLQRQQFINLTTYRKSGQAVVTTVWFAHDGDRLVGLSQPQTGKVKRIRNNPRVKLQPSTASGQIRGDAVDGVARVLPPEEFAAADAALRRKYGLQYRLFGAMLKLRRVTQRVYWEVKPVTESMRETTQA